MRSGSPFKPSREMIAQASAWFIEFRTEHPTQAQRDRFNDWLCTSPQHIQAYFEVAAAWSELPGEDPEHRIDIDAMITAAQATSINVIDITQGMRADARTSVSGTGEKATERSSREATARMRHVISAAAAFVFVLLGAASAYYYTQRGIYRTTVGEQRSLTLADGSTVELNAQSEIRIAYTESERRIDLRRGQALFHVAKNKARPFIVDANGTLVRAVGTQFDVYRKNTGTVVTVVEGRVAITTSTHLPTSQPSYVRGNGGESANLLRDRSRASRSGDRGNSGKASNRTDAVGAEAQRGEILLAAGEQLSVEKSSVTKRERPDIDAATAWTQKRLVFEDTPLKEVAEEFNRYNLRPLVIDGDELQQVGISGLYSSTEPTALIAFLSAQPGIVVTQTETEIHVRRKQN